MPCITTCAGPFEETTGDGPLGHIIDKLRISSLRAQVEASRLYSAELTRKFEAAETSLEKTTIASQYDKSLKQTHAMQLLLEMLERKQNHPSTETAS
jgi:hypothetical protein